VEANRAEARRLLSEAGYPDGFDLRILTRANFFFELLSDFAAGQLAKVGIRAEVVPMESAAYQSTISNGEFDAIGHSHSFPVDDPDAILSANYGCGGAENYPGLCDAELDSLIEQQSRELDEGRRRELLHEIERRIWNYDAKIWLQWSARRTAVNSRVHGMKPGGPSLYQGVRLDLVWVE
jgi:peptide/nickel transport system substrate-binding protein